MDPRSIGVTSKVIVIRRTLSGSAPPRRRAGKRKAVALLSPIPMVQTEIRFALYDATEHALDAATPLDIFAGVSTPGVSVVATPIPNCPSTTHPTSSRLNRRSAGAPPRGGWEHE
jgi:hypothetical protein